MLCLLNIVKDKSYFYTVSTFTPLVPVGTRGLSRECVPRISQRVVKGDLMGRFLGITV